jgi:hypothetical protein
MVEFTISISKLLVCIWAPDTVIGYHAWTKIASNSTQRASTASESSIKIEWKDYRISGSKDFGWHVNSRDQVFEGEESGLHSYQKHP